MNFLLEVAKDMTFGETLALGGEVVLVGMLTVFSVLGLIWVCLTLFKIVFSGAEQRKPKLVAEEKVTPKNIPAPTVTASADEEIIAVIAAAIAAAEADFSGLKFRVVSYRRK